MHGRDPYLCRGEILLMNRQLVCKRVLLRCGHTIVTTAAVAEVLLERAIACREVGVVVSGVVRVCHGGYLLCCRVR